MKNRHSCPKCQSEDILRVPGEVLAFGAGNNIRLGRLVTNAAPVSRYLCASCGFVEEWIEDPADLAKLKAKFAA